MERKVKYNGGVLSYYGCSSPSQLIVGKEYTVIGAEVKDFQTNYSLAGVEGRFNSVWFDEVKQQKKVNLGFSTNLPVVGRPYECYKVESSEGEPKLSPWRTSIVKNVFTLSDNVFQIETCNGLYIVQVD